jgi:hypothetical protein
MTEELHEHHWWYFRIMGKVSGPYAAGLVSRYILLGRIGMDDELSTDKQNWRVVRLVPDLIPDVMKGDLDDPFMRERLMAARRWADERYRGNRRYSEEEQANRERMAGDRRDSETPETIEYRQKRQKRLGIDLRGENTVMGWLLLIASLIAIVYAGYFAYTHQREDKPIDCDSTAKAGVNWRNCSMEGRNLSGVDISKSVLNNANLSGVNLVAANLAGSNLSYVNFSLANLQQARLTRATLLGANLRAANLRGADFTGADMSFVILTDADITDIKLEGANLGKAIWIDGLPCAVNSISACLR